MVHLSQLPRSRPGSMERISLFSRSTVQPVNSTRIDNARQRAEALFKPKSPPKALCANETANEMAHEPRVLSISALTPEQAPTTPEQPTPMDFDRRHFPPGTSSGEIRHDDTADRRNLWGSGVRDPAHSPKSLTGCSCRGMIYRRGVACTGALQRDFDKAPGTAPCAASTTRAALPRRVCP